MECFQNDGGKSMVRRKEIMKNAKNEGGRRQVGGIIIHCVTLTVCCLLNFIVFRVRDSVTSCVVCISWKHVFILSLFTTIFLLYSCTIKYVSTNLFSAPLELFIQFIYQRWHLFFSVAAVSQKARTPLTNRDTSEASEGHQDLFIGLTPKRGQFGPKAHNITNIFPILQ